MPEPRRESGESDRGWLRFLLVLQWVAATSAVLCAIAAIHWPFPFPFFACMFTWQATVVWCRRRSAVDGRNMWERAQPDSTEQGANRDGKPVTIGPRRSADQEVSEP